MYVVFLIYLTLCLVFSLLVGLDGYVPYPYARTEGRHKKKNGDVIADIALLWPLVVIYTVVVAPCKMIGSTDTFKAFAKWCNEEID